MRDKYLNFYGSNFMKFCFNENIEPSLDQFHGFLRIGTPIGMFPAFDTQFYMYFCDDQKTDEAINLNQDEFTEYRWLAIDEALSLFQTGEVPIFHPQIIILTTLLFLNKNYLELKDVFENGFSKNVTTFITNKAHIWDFDQLMSAYGENIGKGELEV